MRAAIEFTCNICGRRAEFREEHWADPEAPSCEECGSNVRFRWLVHRLSREVFGRSMPLSQFPVQPSVRGLGLTDPACIAVTLAERFSYRNTFFHAEPRFDIRSDPSPLGDLDFLIASEVFEHIEPPVDPAFRNAASLLKASGVMLLTVPWVWDGHDPLPELYDWKLDRKHDQWLIVNRTVDGKTEQIGGLSFDDGPGNSLGYTREHFPGLNEWSVAREGEAWRLLNRRRDGAVEEFENLAFHDGAGATLEMRLFTKRSLEKSLLDAGFARVEFEFRDYAECGIFFGYPWSRPLTARIRV